MTAKSVTLTDERNVKPSISSVTNLPYTVRIKIKDIGHYRKCIDSLKECGFRFLTELEDELTMRRDKRLIKKAYLYLGLGRLGYVFYNYSVVRHAKEVTRKELIQWVHSTPPNG